MFFPLHNIYTQLYLSRIEHCFTEIKFCNIQQVIGVLTARNNIKVKNARQPAERKESLNVKVRDTRTNRHRYT